VIDHYSDTVGNGAATALQESSGPFDWIDPGTGVYVPWRVTLQETIYQ